MRHLQQGNENAHQHTLEERTSDVFLAIQDGFSK
jgi:hypothetical protein